MQLNIYCVSHERPLVPSKLFTHEIGIGDYYPDRGVHISTIDPFWHSMRECAYGAAGNYAILQAIQREKSKTTHIGVFSHRKAVIRHQVGTAAANYPVYREINLSQAGKLSREDATPNKGQDFLVGRPINFEQGLVRQYAEFHRALDLFSYLSMAVDIGVLTSDEVQTFALESVFIPGGVELGIYPADWHFKVLSQLESLGRQFLTHYASRIRSYDEYQVRAVGFLAERLGSFLLLRELTRRYPQGIPFAAFGYLCVVVPDGGTYDAATAD